MDEPLAERCDVAVIGGGPAGLAAACALKETGIARVVAIEREAEAGGIPRHCTHSPFGMREFTRILSGPRYARRLVEQAVKAGVDLRTATTAVRIEEGGGILATCDAGPYWLKARRVVLATGIREASRAARLVSGARLAGICNTGALQAMVALKNLAPFRRPVIVGSELVAFSAVLTCLGAGIRSVAMIEEAERVTARWPSALLCRVAGIPLLLRSRLERIDGRERVESVTIVDSEGRTRTLACDGVLFTGGFTPEAALARCGHLRVDAASGGPVVDQFGRCSDPVFFAAGNLLRPVETAGWSWKEGREIGRCVAADLAGLLPPAAAHISIRPASDLIKLAVPQRLSVPLGDAGMQFLQLRLARRASGVLTARDGSGVIWRRHLEGLPERRILIPLRDLVQGATGGSMELRFEDA
jgi:NADPH-dependent 2,4-dienoyl-CoA reductase/sulfur reductase-like enzyme